MRLIDADEVIERVDEWIDPAIQATRWFIISAPTIDAVEVVRCKDCKQYKQYSSVFGKSMECHLLCVKTKENDYCSYGERIYDL